jgi:membrane peptidoglycan carboxypeptidase
VANGLARASGASGRARGVDELDGYGRDPGERAGAGGRGGQHAQGRAPRGGGRGRDWDESNRGSDRDGAQFGPGRRDIRAELRERLRRNGIGSADWDGADGRPRGRPGGPDSWEADRRPLWPFRRRGAGGGDWDGPGGRRPRRKGDWWRRWTWKKALGVVAAAFGMVMILGAAGVAYVYAKTPIPNIQQGVYQQATKVYFSDGKTLVGQFGTTNRVLLNYNQIPPVLRNAVVAAEDKNFWHEGGISPTGILRAAYYDLTSSGGSLQGGSTITQQLVRNYYQGIGTAQTLSRKVKEIFVAQKLAQVKSKEWILQQYLNTIYLGRGAYGVGAAAQVYFGLSTSQLAKMTTAQAAMIAAMIQLPSGYNPDPKAGQAYQGLVSRWHYVLSAMVGMGTLSTQVAAQQKFPTVVKPVNNTWNGYRGYIMQAVENELVNTYNFSPAKIPVDGLRIVTTFNRHLQNSLYASVASVEKLMRHCSPPPEMAGQAPAQCDGLPHYVRVGVVLEQPGTGAILAEYGGPNYNKKHCHCQYDNALQSRNQVGSSFKTYVLATAVSQGMNVQTSVLDGNAPLWIPPDSQPNTKAKTGGSLPPGPGGWYKITNDESGNNSLGPISVKVATAASINTAYADLWHRVAFNPQTGAHPVVDMARAFGVDTQASSLQTMQNEAGTALGQASLTVEEQATTIATLANNGTYVTPHVIKKIFMGNSVVRARVTQRAVLTGSQAADVDWALSFDTVPGGGGTAAGEGLTNGQTVIAKTGTTNLAQSAFFMGATPKYAMAVGMFVDRPTCPPRLQTFCSSQSALAFAPPKGLQTLFGVGGMSGYGGQWPAYLWHTFFMANFNTLTPIPFPQVNNDGSPWNLYGQLPKKHDNNQGGGGCHGQGNGQGHGPCHHNPPPPPTPPPTPTPTVTATLPPIRQPLGTGGAVAGGPGAGAWALAAMVVAGPSLSVLGRVRERRRRALRSTERPPAD